MRGSSVVYWASFVCVTVLACGGEARKNPGPDGAGPDLQEAGADPGGAGYDAGAGSSESGGNGGASGLGGMAGRGAVTSGGTGVAPSGGASMTPSGGASMTPSGGAASTPDPWEPPPTCTTISQSASAEQCNFEFSCDGQTHFTGCQIESEGTWACQCGTFSTATQHFELKGATEAEACSVIARICTSDDPAGVTSCKPKDRTADQESCSAGATCGPELELDSDFVVRRVEHYRAECSATEHELFPGGAFLCECEGGALHRWTYMVEAPSVEDVCGPMLDFCTRGEQPAFTGPEECVVRESGDTATGCLLAQSCGRPAELGGDVAIKDPFDRYVVCDSFGGEEMECECGNASLQFVFQPSSFDGCAAALDVCVPGTVIEPVGEPTCALTGMNTQQSSTCTADLECEQSATVNGDAIVGRGFLGVRCHQKVRNGPWWCSCASFEDAMTFELGAMSSPSAACTAAAQRCPDEIAPVIGPSDGRPHPPAPSPEKAARDSAPPRK